MRRAAIIAKVEQYRWAGHTGQAFATTAEAANPAQLVAALKAAVAANPNAWHLIELVDGTWTADFETRDAATNTRPKFNASGGCVIRNKAGNNPILTGQVNAQGRRLEWQNVTFANRANFSYASAVACVTVGPLIASAGEAPIMIFRNCRVGSYWRADASTASWNSWSRGIYTDLAEYLGVFDCVFRHCTRPLFPNACMVFESAGNDFLEYLLNPHSVSQYTSNANGPLYKGILPEDDCFYWIRKNTDRGCLDNASEIGLPLHTEHIQHMDVSGSQEGRTAPWAPAANPPGKLRVVCENIICHSDPIDAVIEGVNYAVPSSNMVQVTDYKAPSEWIVWNNIQSSVGFFMQALDKAEVFVECNTSGPPARIPALVSSNGLIFTTNNLTADSAANQTQAIVINSAKNIFRNFAEVGTSDIVDSGTLFFGDQASTPVGQRPQDRWQGTFSQNAQGRWVPSGLTNMWTKTQEEFRQALWDQFRPQPGNDVAATFA